MLDQLQAKDQSLGFPVYCDPKREAVKAFGVYDAAHDISLPAVIVLDAQGKIAWKHVGESVFDRPEEEALVSALKGLKKKG